VNVISRLGIIEAVARHPVCAAWLNRWWQLAKKAEWNCLDDVRQIFPSVDQVGNRLVFNATAGRRLIVDVSYASDKGKGALFVKAFLTHAEYEKNQWRD
jgi:mRNA interferase HigB